MNGGQGRVSVTTYFKDRNGRESEETHDEGCTMEGKIEPHELVRVRIGIGTTMNLGNYESARIDVGVEYPCSIHDVDAGFAAAEALAQAKAGEYLDKVKSKAAAAMREMFDHG